MSLTGNNPKVLYLNPSETNEILYGSKSKGNLLGKLWKGSQDHIPFNMKGNGNLFMRLNCKRLPDLNGIISQH